MVKLIFIRGSSAVGKTTISKELLKVLKKDHSLNCAFISEDNFRKEMQFKYLARELKVHKNSVEIIKTVILKLLELDSYDLIILEGQFRYFEVLEAYEKFANEQGLERVFFQFVCDSKERIRRDKLERVSKGSNPKDPNVDLDINSNIPEDAIKIDTSQDLEITLDQILKKIV